MNKTEQNLRGDGAKNLLLGVSGSVAAIKVEEILEALESQTVIPPPHVKVIATQHALPFLSDAVKAKAVTSEDEWASWKGKGDPVLHIELRKWAHLFVILPLSANTLGKITNGICDNLLTSVCRAWDFRVPLLVFPAMNTLMWEHPITSQQLQVLQSWKVDVIFPVEKALACGDVGMGALPSPGACVSAIVKAVAKNEMC